MVARCSHTRPGAAGLMARAEQTILAFDFGLRRIGIAVGEALIGSARALVTIRGDCPGPDWPAIDALLAEWSPGLLVVGRPVHADGSESPMSEAATAFAAELAARSGREVSLVDERLSSSEARDRVRRERRSGERRRRVRREEIDALAAEVILRDYMNQDRTA